MLERAGLARFLEFYLSNEDVTKSKPDSEVYDKAITQLGVKPSECLVLEDNQHGIEAARKAGAHVLEIHSVEDTNYSRIVSFIDALQKGTHLD